ncbi:MAG: hypothetical protein GY835_22445 [bacterium]|nr:hypothetical protein [bacterium]
MNRERIDPSLAEVRQWRESLQSELSHLDSKAEAQDVHRRAEAFMRDYGLRLKTQSRTSERDR